MKKLLLTCCVFMVLATTSVLRAQTVVTDTRFARGATMAFGRMVLKNVPAAQLEEQGFCYAEHAEPTVGDLKHVATIKNGGTIYWMKDLKPATKYFMRAYAILKDGTTLYGDVVKFYTIPMGQITYTIRNDGPTADRERITNATKQAIDLWNNLTEMKGFSPNVGYDAGVQTADCSYGGWIRVGKNASYQAAGTIMHEMLHGCGVIPWADTEWSRHNLRASVNGDGYGTGKWLGDRVTEVLSFWDNKKSEQLNGDYQHMWPYGINGAHEDNGTNALYIGNSLVCQALGEDGLQHTYTQFAQPYYAFDQEDDVKYYLTNESADRGLNTAFLVANASGTLKWVEMTEEEAVDNDSTAWYITFSPDNQYYQFRNAGTGQYLTYESRIKTASRSKLTANDDWHLMKGRVDVDGQRGYWIIHPEANWTPHCLQANRNGVTGAAVFDIANSATAQRWIIKSLSGVTGVREIRQEEPQRASGIYDLQGRRVKDTSRKGIYIINGKKFLVK